MQTESNCLLYASFADLFAYPTPEIRQQADDCLARLRDSHPESTTALERFSSDLKKCTLEQLQELYTATFDMQPVCYPYVGYQLFGESYKRGAFMAQLNNAYSALGYSAGQELPDNLSVILRFLSLDGDNRQVEFSQTLMDEGLSPALEKMLQAFDGESKNPYAKLLEALRSLIISIPRKDSQHA